MGSDHPLAVGMFWGGLIMAMVPLLFSFGVGAYVLRRLIISRRQQDSDESGG